MTAPRPYPRHLCIGPMCWTCGEPNEIRRMRHAMAGVLLPEVGQRRAHELALLCAQTIHPEVLPMMVGAGQGIGAESVRSASKTPPDAEEHTEEYRAGYAAAITAMQRLFDPEPFDSEHWSLHYHAMGRALIAHEIRRELVCCTVADTGDPDHARTTGHDLCYWGEMAARIAERGGDDPEEETGGRLRRPGAPWRLLVHEWRGRQPGRREGENGIAHHITSTPEFGGRTRNSAWTHEHVLPPTEFDELVVGQWLHIEQVDTHTWWLLIGGVVVHVTADREGRPTHVWVAGPGDYDEPAPGCTYRLTWGTHQEGQAPCDT